MKMICLTHLSATVIFDKRQIAYVLTQTKLL